MTSRAQRQGQGQCFDRDSVRMTPRKLVSVKMQRGDVRILVGGSSSPSPRITGVVGSEAWPGVRTGVTHTEARSEAQAGPCKTGEEPTCPALLLQFKNPLILLLLASALVSILTKEYEDAISIAMVSMPRQAWPLALSPWPWLPKGLRTSCLFIMQGTKSLAVEGARKWVMQQNERKASPRLSLHPYGGVLVHLAFVPLVGTQVASVLCC